MHQLLNIWLWFLNIAPGWGPAVAYFGSIAIFGIVLYGIRRLVGSWVGAIWIIFLISLIIVIIISYQ